MDSQRDATDTDLNERPVTHDELVRVIANRFDGLSKRLKQIAQYALDNPNEFALGTIAQISEQAEVQPSALIRFAKAFDFDGFTEIQRLFQQRLLDTRPSYENRLDSLRKHGSSGRPRSLMTQVVHADVAALNHLESEVSDADLQRAFDILGNAEMIHIMAMRRAYPLAAYFYYAVRKMGHRAVLIDNHADFERLQVDNVAANEALFAISFATYTPQVVHAAEHFRARGLPVVAITDHPLSPLTTRSDVCFHVEDAAVHDFRTLNASMCLTQTLAMGLGVVQRITT